MFKIVSRESGEVVAEAIANEDDAYAFGCQWLVKELELTPEGRRTLRWMGGGIQEEYWDKMLDLRLTIGVWASTSAGEDLPEAVEPTNDEDWVIFEDLKGVRRMGFYEDGVFTCSSSHKAFDAKKVRFYFILPEREL